MNWSTAIMLFLAWQLLSQNNQTTPKLQDIAPFLNEDTRGILDGVAKLSSPTATSEDKTGAILQMMTNPTVMSFAQNLFGGGDTSKTQTATQEPQSSTQSAGQDFPFGANTQPQTTAEATTQGASGTFSQPQTFADSSAGASAQACNTTERQFETSQEYQNDEGYTFASPTERARQFFAPIDPIATTEIKHKLCYFYDNWYLAK